MLLPHARPHATTVGPPMETRILSVRPVTAHAKLAVTRAMSVTRIHALSALMAITSDWELNAWRNARLALTSQATAVLSATASAWLVMERQTFALLAVQIARLTSFSETIASIRALQAWVATLESALTASSPAPSAQPDQKFASAALKLRAWHSFTGQTVSISVLLASLSMKSSRSAKGVAVDVTDVMRTTSESV